MDKKLLETLVCPACKGALDYRRRDAELVCPRCELAYPVRDGIAVLLADEAVKRPAGEQQ